MPINKRFSPRFHGIFIVLLLVFPAPLFAATYYVSPGGNDSADGSSGARWKTLSYAVTKMVGGDTLLIGDGTYRGPENQIWNLPNGMPDQYTTLRAENPFRVILEGTGANQYDHDHPRTPIRLLNNAYIRISDLKIRNSPTGGAVLIVTSHHVKILRLSIINGTRYDDPYGSPITIGLGSHHILCEDLWVAGAMRYGVLVTGNNNPGSDPTRDTTSQIILRRVVVRWDYMKTIEPKAGIAFYGADNLLENGGVTDSVCQNCVVLDMNPGEGYNNHYGAYYNPKNTLNIAYYGSMALNIRGKTTESDIGGFFIADNYTGNKGQRLVNSVAWDIAGAGVRFSNGDPKGFGKIEQSTIGKSDYGIEVGGEMGISRLPVIVKNTLFVKNNEIHPRDLFSSPSSHNLYFPSSLAFLLKTVLASHKTDPLTSDPKLKYLTRIESNSPAYQSGENGLSRGATILYRYGAPETLMGEPGWDTLTAIPLWPWPYQDEIKADFGMSNNPPLGAYPPVNNTQRGFVATSLTRYIWEYLGQPCPSKICFPVTSHTPRSKPMLAGIGHLYGTPQDNNSMALHPSLHDLQGQTLNMYLTFTSPIRTPSPTHDSDCYAPMTPKPFTLGTLLHDLVLDSIGAVFGVEVSSQQHPYCAPHPAQAARMDWEKKH